MAKGTKTEVMAHAFFSALAVLAALLYHDTYHTFCNKIYYKK